MMKTMKQNNKIPFILYLFFILIYFNQGISSLPGQCIYYLTRESWGLSATMIGLIGCITGLAWYIKFVWGYIADSFPSRNKQILYFNYILIIAIYLYIIIFGLNIWTLIGTGLLTNMCIGFNDVINDKAMVILEKKHNLRGKLQALQWTSLGVAGLIVSLLGAKIAFSFPETINYRIAYAFASIVPILTIFYLIKYYKCETVSKKPKFHSCKEIISRVKNKRFLIAILFIICLQLCPSFGTALMIKAREQLGVSKMFLGYLGATGTVLGITGYALYYWKVYKFRVKHLLYFMVIFTGITNLFYLYIPNQWYLLIYNLMFGVFGGITFLTLLAFFAKIVPTGYEGMFYAIVTSVSNFCARGSGLLGGIIYDHFGYSICVIVSSVLTLVCVFFIPYLKLEELELKGAK